MKDIFCSWHTQCFFWHCNIPPPFVAILLQWFHAHCQHSSWIHICHNFITSTLLVTWFLWNFVLQLVETAVFHHLHDSALVQHPHLVIQSYLYKIIKNRRQAAAALLLYRRQNHCVYLVHPINQSCQQFDESNPLYKDLRKYPDSFYTYYRMSTEQFD